MSKSSTNGHSVNGNGHANGQTNGHAVRFAVPFPEDRSPPHSLAAEEGVLGAILLDDGVFPAVAEILRPLDFWIGDHQVVYGAMLNLRAAGKPPDAVLVDHELRRIGKFEEVGGLDLLTHLVNRVPHAANAVYHARIVKEMAEKRRIIATARKVVDDGFGHDKTSDDLAESISGALEGLATGRNTITEEATSVCLDDVQAEAVDWIWPDRIPKGMLCAMIGDPELGKSFVTQGLAATLSLGARWPDNETQAPLGSTIFLAAEDSLSFTMKPRLIAAGADCKKIHAVTMVTTKSGRKRAFTLANDIPPLDALIARIGDVRLVVIDPINAYLGGTDSHKDADIRGLLTPLKEMAERHGVAVLMVMHMNKSGGTKAIYRANGTLAFVAASRVAWLIARDPHDRERKLMLPAKCNIARNPSGMAFRIRDGAIEWEATTLDMHADDALIAEAKKPDKGKPGPITAKTREAMEWVEAKLTQPRRHGELRRAAEEAGITTTTFYRAIEELKVERFEVESKKWFQMPPREDEDPPATVPFTPEKPPF